MVGHHPLGRYGEQPLQWLKPSQVPRRFLRHQFGWSCVVGGAGADIDVRRLLERLEAAKLVGTGAGPSPNPAAS